MGNFASVCSPCSYVLTDLKCKTDGKFYVCLQHWIDSHYYMSAAWFRLDLDTTLPSFLTSSISKSS